MCETVDGTGNGTSAEGRKEGRKEKRTDGNQSRFPRRKAAELTYPSARVTEDSRLCGRAVQSGIDVNSVM